MKRDTDRLLSASHGSYSGTSSPLVGYNLLIHSHAKQWSLVQKVMDHN